MKRLYLIGLLCLSSHWVLAQCPNLQVSAQVRSASCGILNDGKIVLQVQGGEEPYQYSWSNGSKSQSAKGLSAGTYTVEVTDATGCTTTFSQVVDVRTELALTTEIMVPTGATTPDGILRLNPNGGVEPYTFQISDYTDIQNIKRFSSQDREITGLRAGRYTVDVIDSRGCINTVMVRINNKE
ncbi:MAG: SprB repeat-containing protein [Bacteroidota bacterium]